MKKRQPINSLTEQDEYNIKKYIELYGHAKCGPLDVVFKEWNKNKRRIYRLFGDQLQIEKEIIVNKPYYLIEQELNKIYRPIFLTFSERDRYMHEVREKKTSFLDDFLCFISKNERITNEECLIISKFFSYRNIISGVISNCNIDHFKMKAYSFSCKNGMKTIRTIQKCLKAIKYDNIDLFNDWVNSINIIDKKGQKRETLVLSINPIDFMTMSDNNAKWSSCMSWINDGCYHAGTIEMMNSNLAIVAYLKSKNDFLIKLDEDNILRMPNKTWRELVFFSKNFIVAGKAYPYQSDDISKQILDWLENLAKDKFNWTYKFSKQEYKDIKNYHGNYFLKYNAQPNYKNHHKVIVYTNGMYNDMIEDTESTYWCSRNKTKNGLRLNLSGKLSCICCGKIYNKNSTFDFYSPSDISRTKICYTCNATRCSICGKIKYNMPYRYKNFYFCSDDCMKESYYFKGQNIIISRSDFLSKLLVFYLFCRNNEIEIGIRAVLDKIDDFNSILTIKNILTKEGYISGKDFIIKSFPKSILYKIQIPITARSLYYHINTKLYTDLLENFSYRGYYTKNNESIKFLKFLISLKNPQTIFDLNERGDISNEISDPLIEY